MWRRTETALEVLLIHRPRYDDWSFPKGKLDPGETDEECALRELAEETGLVGELGIELTAVDYIDHRDRPKRVRYWLVTLERPSLTNNAIDDFVVNDEVDELAWLDESEAAARLSYDHDRVLLTEALESLA